MAEPKVQQSRYKFWDNTRVLGDIQKADKSFIRVTLAAKSGMRYILLNEMYVTRKEPDVLKYGKGCIKIPVEQVLHENNSKVPTFNAFIPMFLEVFEAAVTEVNNFPLEAANEEN